MSILLLVVMVMTTMGFVNANELQINDKEILLKTYGSDFLENHDNSYLNHEKLINSFATTKLSETIYPEYYGGSYIDDFGNLVIYVKETEIDKFTSIASVLEIEGYKTKPANYSYNELNSIMATLNTFKLDNPKNIIAKNFNSYYLLDSENIIVVELDDLTEKQILLFEEYVIDSSAIQFKQSEGTNVDEASVYPGQKLSASSSSASMGYRAKKGSTVGFVTAQHFVGTGDKVNISGTTIGEVTDAQYSGSVDAAFVKITNSSYTPSNTLNGTSDTLSTSTSKPGAGTVINKRGFKTGHTTGKVISTNATWTVNNVTFTNLTTADYNSDGGDSGGIVYSYVSSTNTRYTLGIHKGASESTRCYVKADEINSALGLSRY